MAKKKEQQPRTFVIGDIHGSYKALMDVFKKSKFDYEKDTLISLGDVVDGYPDSKKVVNELLKVKNLIAIRGNHDLWFKDHIESGEKMDVWITQGGRSTIKSYGDDIPEEHKEFFINTQRDFHLDEKGRLFVHAGIYPFKEPGEEFEDILHGLYGKKNYTSSDEYYRFCHWIRELDQIARLFKTNDVNLETLSETSYHRKHCILFNGDFKEIYVGHTPKKEVFNYGIYWNVDTDCGWGGALTMMDIDTKEQFQSKPSRELYPNYQVRG